MKSLLVIAVLIGIGLVWQFGGTLSYHQGLGAGHSKAGSARAHHLAAARAAEGHAGWLSNELRSVERDVQRSAAVHASELGRIAGISHEQKRPSSLLAVGASHSQCAHRRPYHVILPATSQTYQEWQTRIHYYHYLKQRRENPCSDLGDFTRLLSSPDALNDTLAKEIPTYPVKQLRSGRCDECDHGFVVLNRPYGLKQFVLSQRFREIREQFLFIVEPDHLLLRPPANVASVEKPVGFGFYYMTYKYDTRKLRPVVAKYHDPDKVDPVGPSPLIIAKEQFGSLVEPWFNLCLELKRDREADVAFGWVLEMWAWTLAAARAGVRHQVHTTFQAEAGGLGIRNLGDYDIFHYTFDMHDNGGWSWSKRHFSSSYPPRLTSPEPSKIIGTSTLTFVHMMNEAIDTFPDWSKASDATWRRRLFK